MPTRVFLYLTKPEWCRSWTHGGHVPVRLASTYKAIERRGIQTPDENLIHNSPFDLTKSPLLSFGPTGGVKGLTMKGNYLNGQRLPDAESADYYTEDGLILSFSTKRGQKIADRLGKSACVEIANVEDLKAFLDRQIGVAGQMGRCRYTSDHQRGHFLKHVDDAWQHEFRLFWRSPTDRAVYINPGTARRVSLK